MEGEELPQAVLIQELITVELLLKDDDYYHAIATPLKSAEACKAEHRSWLHEAVKLDNLKSNLDQAISLIRRNLPYAKQKFTEQTLDETYTLARNLLQEKRSQEASSLFLLLTLIDPAVFEYWLGQGIAYSSMEKYVEALVYFKIAIVLNPHVASPLVHMLYAQLKLNDINAAKNTLSKINGQSLEQKQLWSTEISNMTTLIKGEHNATR